MHSRVEPDGKGAPPAKMLVIFALAAALAVAIALAVIRMTN